MFPFYVVISSHIAPDKFYVEPRDQQSVGEQILEIDRVTQELSLAGTVRHVIVLFYCILSRH